MTILDRIRHKIRPTNETIPAPEPDMNGTITTEVGPDQATGLPKIYIPIAVGEYLPWKGIVFKITAVGESSFTAHVAGLTPARARKAGRA